VFANACSQVRESVYGLIGISQVGPAQVNAGNATGFIIAPGFLATAAHFVHVDGDRVKPVHSIFEAIRAPEIGQQMERATFVAEDATRDVAILRIDAPRSDASVTLEPNAIPAGTSLRIPRVPSCSGRVFPGRTTTDPAAQLGGALSVGQRVGLWAADTATVRAPQPLRD